MATGTQRPQLANAVSLQPGQLTVADAAQQPHRPLAPAAGRGYSAVGDGGALTVPGASPG